MVIFILGSLAGWTQFPEAFAQQGAPTPQITLQPLPTGGPGAGTAAAPPSQPTPQQAEVLKSLTPEQKAAAMSEAGKTGGQITPEALEALKARPEFKGLSPEDVIRGKQLLEQKEQGRMEVKEGEKKTLLEDRKSVITTEVPAQESLFARTRRIGAYQAISLDLKPFGYDFFGQAAVRVQTDKRDIPVPMKYVIGPGDEVKLLLWGRVNAQYNLTVDRDGKITIPQVGPLFVAGMTFEEMSKYIIKQSEQIVGTNVDISMGALKTIQVFILGDVQRPGPYTIGSFATITDALIMAGGPTAIGSMRNVQLKRKGQLVTTFDLYDLLLKGDKSKDMTLLAGDVVFVPVTGPLVGIAGNVKRPAIYELRDSYDLETLINLAGGIIPTAYTQQIQVERIVKNERHIVLDINDKNLEKAAQVRLQDADLVKVFNIVDANVNAVYLNGNIKRPGKYEIKAGMRLGDLLRGPEDFLPETHFDYALIKRLKPPAMETILVPVDLGAIVLKKDHKADIELKPQDQVFVFNKWFFEEKPFAVVEGEIRGDCNADQGAVAVAGTPKAACRVRLADNMRVRDAILASGGLTYEAYMDQGQILRKDKKGNYHTLYFSVEKALAGDPVHNRLLEKEDRITIHSILEYEYRKNVFVEGEVANPGQYQYTEGMRVRDLVFRGGNILESAYLDEAEIASLVIEGRRGVRTEKKVINLRKALAGDPAHNVPLKPHDHLLVKRIPEWGPIKYVTLSGEFRFPGRYAIHKGERLSSVIERAGGYLPTAYLRGAYFTRESVRRLQQKSLEDMTRRLERELLSTASTQIGSSLTAEEVQSKTQEIQFKQRLIDYMRGLKATGRMTIAVSNLRLLKGSPYDIELEDGDALYLPTKNNVVNVAGAVMSESSHIYVEKWSYNDYIRAAGGFARYADTDNIFVLKVDGSARKLTSGVFEWSEERERWEVAGYGDEPQKIEPGDVIVVPDKVTTIAWLREIRDITQILMNTAVTAATIIKLW